MVAIVLSPGFEEAEAIIPCDLLRRANIPAIFVSESGSNVSGSHGIDISADASLDEIHPNSFEMLVLPGGLRGVQNYYASDKLKQLVIDFYNDGKYIAAICAAPSFLASLGIFKNRHAVCYPGMEDKMGTAEISNTPVCIDGKLITGKAAGCSFDFGLALVAELAGTDAAQKIAKAICFENR